VVYRHGRSEQDNYRASASAARPETAYPKKESVIDVLSTEKQPVVFTGLTVSQPEAQALVNAEICPPVRSGDLDRLRDGKTVVIIDGVLEPEPVLSVAEIRRALQRGLKIQGAASLGALRAHQTHGDGMEGSGWVYQAYVSGRIQGTDEISVIYDPFSHRPLTVPLVNIRFCLLRLVRRGTVAECDAEKAMSDLKCIPPEERSRRAVVHELVRVFGRERLKAALNEAAGMNSNIKRRDALEMLQTTASSPIAPAPVRSKPCAMPAHDALRADNGERVATLRKQAANPTKNQPVCGREWKSGCLTPTQHNDLLPKHEDFCVQRRS
jgi:hypothetical protein